MALIAHYKLDGNSLDSSGNGYNLTTNTATPTTAGKIGGCYTFASGNAISATSGINLPHNVSFTAWAYNNNAFAGNMMIFSCNSTLYSGPDLYFTGTIAWNTGDGAANPFKKDGVNVVYPSSNAWHHYAVVNNQELNKAFLYIDGEYYGEAIYRNTFQENRGFTIGNYFPGSTGYAWKGMIDDVKIFDHALSEKEIKELAKAKILHYTFDEFQEPTYNWFYKQNPRVDSSYTPYTATTSGTWQANHSNAIRVYNDEGSEITGYINSGVTDWTNTYHAIWEYDYGLKMPVVVQNDVDGNWKAKSWGLGQTMSSMGLSPGMKYTISWLQWTNNISKRLRVGLYGLNSSGSSGFHDGQLYPANTMPYTWERVSATFTVSSVWNFSASLNCYMYGHYDTRAIIKIADVQMEIKDHSTEFSKSPSRTGSVSDISGYDNHADLALATTPQWTSDSRIGTGCYKTGASSFIKRATLSAYIPAASDYTQSIWIYPTIIAGRQVFIDDYNRWEHWAAINSNGTIYASYYNGGQYGCTSANTTTINQWYHVAVSVVSGVSIKLYVNGELWASNTSIGGIHSKVYDDIVIGANGGDSLEPFDGYVDDVRIYATALSANDVKKLYNTRAQVDNKGNFFANNLQQTGHQPLLLDYTTWQNGQVGAIGQFGVNGSSEESVRVITDDPWGKASVVWETRPDATSGADGGWNSSSISVDNTKNYRFIVWVRRPTNETGGTFYFGLNGSIIRNDTGVVQSNPYFSYIGQSELSVGVWYLVVGHCFSKDYIGGIHPDSGWYTVIDGKIATKSYGNIGASDCRFQTTQTSILHRTYHFYTTNVLSRLQFAYPRIDVCDGTEPSIAELLSGFDSNYIDYIRMKGGTSTLPLNVGDQLTYAGEISEIGPTNGLVAYYPLNGDANDYANANDGTVNGAIISAGINGKACYSFDGVDDYIQIEKPITGIWDFPFTFSVWAKATSGSGRGLILGDFSMANSINVNIEWNTTALRLYWNGSPDINASLSLAYDTWTFLTIVRDKDSSQVRFYKNGVLGYTYSGALVDKTPTTGLHRIGSDARTGEPVFNGLIQNMRLYNRNLSAEEIKILYDLERGDTIKVKMDKNTLYLQGEINETL